MPPAKRAEERPVTSRDIPRLLAILNGCDDEAKPEALRSLCPCRNRRYDEEVWRAVFAALDSPDAAVRDDAQHVVAELRARVRTDPRTQELLGRLAAEVPAAAALTHNVPVWYEKAPLPKGLVVPRFERGHRSSKNKQR
jgi:hypothetical protein